MLNPQTMLQFLAVSRSVNKNMVTLHWRKTIVIILFLANVNINCFASPRKDPPSSTAIMVDVPVRILGVGLTVVSSAIFVVASPFALISGSFEETWHALVIEPLEFTFTRPMGQFDHWKTNSTTEKIVVELED
jgi:hypothetical protein